MRRPPAVVVDARPTPVPRSGGVTVPLAVLVATLLGVLLVGAPPAAAHDTLLSTDPADGAEVDAPPEEVVLTFSADQLDVGAAVVVEDEAGTDWADGDTVVDGPRVRQPLDPELPAGTYTVRWRSVSSDGHTLDGELSFTVTGGPAGTSPDPATADPEETAEPTADETTDPADPADPTDPTDPTVEPTTEPSAAPTPDTEDGAPADEAGGTPVWLWVLLGVAAVGGVLTALVRRDPR